MSRYSRLLPVVFLLGAMVAAGWYISRPPRQADSMNNAAPPVVLDVTDARDTADSAKADTSAAVTMPAKSESDSTAKTETKTDTSKTDTAKSEPVKTETAKPADTTPAPAPAPETKTDQTAQPPAAKDPVADAKKLISDGKKFEARALLTPVILAAPEGPQREAVRAILDQINRDIFFSRAASPDSEMYEVKKGDALAIIAKNYGKDVYFSDLIMKINGMKDPKRLLVGRKIKVPKGEFSALVQKKAHRLIVLFNGAYIKEYKVALGAADTPTPTGKFKISNNKLINPDWYAPDGSVKKFGDPENILGTRWIGIESDQVPSGLGIHGTTQPDTVGQDASNGCVRMLNDDVQEVFTMLMPGNAVEIVP